MAKSFAKNAGVLAVSVILAKVLGAIYRIPLTATLGAEGMGLYQFVYPVFALILTLSSGAVPSAISITVSEKFAVGEEIGGRKAFATALKLCLIVGISGTLLLVGISYPISLLQSKDAFLGYIVVAPAILIVTLISAFRGYFMGLNDLRPSSISQITEGVVKLAVGLSLTAYLIKFGVKYAVLGALFGVVASELVTLVVMAIAFLIKDKKILRVKLREETDTVKKVAKLAVPLIVSGMILPISQFIDSVLIVNLLKLAQGTNPIAEYGLWSGVVTPLINLPVMVCITLGIAVTPQMVEGRQRRDIDYVMDKANTANKLTFLLGVPFVIFYFFMADGIVKVLFPSLGQSSTVASLLLRINAISVLGLSIFQIYSAMLQGLQKPYVPVKIMAVCMGIKLVLSIILVPTIGIVGCAISASVGYTLSGIIITVYFAKFVSLDKQYVKNASLITACGVIMGTLVFMFGKIQTSYLTFGIVTLSAIIVYFLSILLLKVFSKEELKTLPLSGLLIKLNDKINGEKNDA